MARIGINAAEVTAAFEKLLTQGEQPTAEKIQNFLGKGTAPIIQKHLDQIFEQSRLDLLSPTESAPPAAAPVIAAPEAPMAAATEAPVVAIAAPEASTKEEQPSKERRSFNNRRERFNNNRPNNGSGQQQSNRSFDLEEPAAEKPLEELSDDTLVAKIRRLESILLKEQMRRDVAERIMIETKDYADTIKEQVSQRINDLRQNMDEVIEQLKTQLREQKHNYDQDLKYYQEQLSKANEKIASLAK